MRLTSFAATILLPLVALLSGCVTTERAGIQTVSTKVNVRQAHVEQAVFVIKAGEFEDDNSAARAGQMYFDSLLPLLEERLPVVFNLNGFPARAISPGDNPFEIETGLDLKKNERIFLIRPLAAKHVKITGVSLYMDVQLFDRTNRKVVWRADIVISELIFGKFSHKVPDQIARQILEKLRADKLINIAAGPIKTP